MKKKWSVYIPVFRTPIEPQREIFDPVADLLTDPARDEQELSDRLSGADAVLTTLDTRITRTVIETSPHLKVIGKYGVGVENIDVEAATRAGIPVTYIPLVNSNATADLTIGLILAALRRIQIAKAHMKTGAWKDDRFLGLELRDKTIGIIGYGNVAKLVIRKLQGFDVDRILVFSESRSGENPEWPNVRFTDLESLLRESDIVSIHKTLTPRSKGLIGKPQLKIMRRSAFLINTARGPLVDENSLIDALKNGTLAGAALDVYEREPLAADSPLLALDNVVLTPHIGGVTHEARNQMVSVLARNVVDLLEGRRIDDRYIVNREVFVQKQP
ncbi:MAG: hydroxyacid dehydrogenase [Deltaproteobacteria bacterium]|nr:hydroxyacid dehydrogenase [Deltaproteobacteria bacterium]